MISGEIMKWADPYHSFPLFFLLFVLVGSWTIALLTSVLLSRVECCCRGRSGGSVVEVELLLLED